MGRYCVVGTVGNKLLAGKKRQNYVGFRLTGVCLVLTALGKPTDCGNRQEDDNGGQVQG